MFIKGTATAFPGTGIDEEISPEMVASRDIEDEEPVVRSVEYRERVVSRPPTGRGSEGPQRSFSVRVGERLELPTEVMDTNPTGEGGSAGPGTMQMASVPAEGGEQSHSFPAGEGGSMDT